ncbi:MAG: putative lipid II flippase FtsW [Verrucomicrobiia bacterium]
MKNQRISLGILLCAALLLSIGLVMLYSAGMGQKGPVYVRMQFAWALIGGVALVACSAIDYHKLKSPVVISILYGVAALLLLAVFIPGLGVKINGAQRWINIGFARFQPSEFAKIALILTLAFYCDYKGRKMKYFSHGIVVPSVLIGFMAGLIILGKDYGSTILTGAVCLAILAIGGARFRYIFLIVLAGCAGLYLAITMNQNRSDRIRAWLNPEEYATTIAYQNIQAKIALGSGGWTGRGLGESRQKHGFIPEQHTDFILAIIGEELGLVATLMIVLLYIFLVTLGGLVAYRAPDLFGLLVAAGLTIMIGLQAAINIAVVTGAVPNKGLPLPFISYGGSNLLLMMASIGLLLNVARKGQDTVIEAAPEEDLNPFGVAEADLSK